MKDCGNHGTWVKEDTECLCDLGYYEGTVGTCFEKTDCTEGEKWND